MRDRPVARIPLWLDVDTGVDDALAIAYAVRSGANLIGVSTVAGNVPIDYATDNTCRVLAWVGASDVPVHRGASRPLAGDYHDAAHVHGEDGLGGAELGVRRAREFSMNGVEAILEAAESLDDSLVIVAVGPLTNLAIALSLRPKLVRQIRRLVIMSGAFDVRGNVTEHAEFNAFADPHAAAQVMDADWRELIAVGLDVTHQTVISRDQWERVEEAGPPTATLVRQTAARTFLERGLDGFYLHDPLAAAVALDPKMVSTQPHRVDVTTDGERRGKTTAIPDGGVGVALSVDVARFEQRFAERLAIPVRRVDVAPDRSE